MITSNTIDEFSIEFENENSSKWMITFNFPISCYFITNDFSRTIVLTEPPTSAGTVANMFCIDNILKKIIWEKSAHDGASGGNIYVKAKPLDGKLFRAWDFDCYRETIEIESGKTISKDFVR